MALSSAPLSAKRTVTGQASSVHLSRKMLANISLMLAYKLNKLFRRGFTKQYLLPYIQDLHS